MSPETVIRVLGHPIGASLTFNRRAAGGRPLRETRTGVQHQQFKVILKPRRVCRADLRAGKRAGSIAATSQVEEDTGAPTLGAGARWQVCSMGEITQFT